MLEDKVLACPVEHLVGARDLALAEARLGTHLDSLVVVVPAQVAASAVDELVVAPVTLAKPCEHASLPSSFRILEQLEVRPTPHSHRSS